MDNNNNNQIENANQNQNQIENQNENQIENANQNENENEMKNLEKKVTKNLIKDYSNLLKENSFKDFSIFVENKSNPFEIKVHKSILSSRSPFFNKFLKERNEIDKIFLNQFNKKEMESILSYIYYGNISFENQENLIQLLEISIYFKLNLLKEFIQKKILNSINYSNFFQFLFQNRNLNSNEIEIKCFELINQNFSQIQNNENLFNLTKEEIIKFIQFKQEKKEIFQFDFFQFLNNWIEKRNERLKGKKEKEKEKKRLFHSFFSLFDKDSIPKQDFYKLKQFDFFLPNSFLVDIQNKVIQDNQKENQIQKEEIDNKEKKIPKKMIRANKKQEKKIQRRDKKIQRRDKKISSFKSENQKQKQEIEKQKKDIQNLKSENEKKDNILKQKDEEIQNLKLSIEKSNQNEKKLLNMFPDSIIQEIEYVLKLQEWINDNEFFSKMKKGFSAKKDGFTGNKWHSICDNKGKTLIIIKTTDNYIFGGFTQVGFKSGSNRYIKDSNAFIFSLKNPKNDLPQKFEIQENREDYAIRYVSSNGPRFGDHRNQYCTDILISSDLHKGHTDFGATYKLPNGLKHDTNEAKSYLAGSYSDWTVDEIETYFI
ncbi:pep-cterm sorting domain-containing protein [Anaeramoeba ignava]|uniref:Pep-cterm sorting domain-containing protein n=1 Tax=Anaeramoeba ignava TaxID=1746090 RepID=A0A9Q0RCJ0_ANAIG|nr:pep-cterm sorting domain-containing protein [Anaeramoeba ignava]